MRTEYSPYKAIHHRDRIEDLKKGKLIAPVQLQIDLTNKCNHNCLYCTYRHYKNPPNIKFNKNDTIPTKRIISLISEAKEYGVKAIILLGGGEPLIHPEILDIIKHIDKLGLEYGLVTNGTLMKKENAPLFKKASWVRFSIDAASNKVYKLVHETKDDIPIKQIAYFRKICKKPVLGISFLTKPENYHEAYECAKLAKSIPVDNIRFSVVNTQGREDIMENYYKAYMKLVSKAIKLEDENFKVFGLKERKEAMKGKHDYSVCLFQQFVGIIAADGYLYPCCWTKNYLNYRLGSIYEGTFKEVWFGEKRKKFLENHKPESCPVCWFDESNKFLNYLTCKDPRHINFV